jgi:hypothetical protein
MHEYYTPSILADAIADCPLLPSLAGTTGVVRALEPSAGIGRLVRAFSGKRGSADPGTRPQGTFNLIVSNPPYGERGAAALEDHDAGPGPGATACKSAHSEDDA